MEMRKSFSKLVPGLQLAWDATSMYALQFCPYYYKLTIVDGHRTNSVDLEFGTLLHSSLEVFDHARAKGASKEEATRLAFTNAVLATTLNNDDANPKFWGGDYYAMWKCSGKVVNPKTGRKVMCPYSKTPQLTTRPAFCGMCGEETEELIGYVPGDDRKNRETLIRTVVWYCEEQSENIEEGFHPFIFEDGTPAIELSFNFPLGIKSEDGESFVVCGHLDGISEFGPERFGLERKSTKSTVSGYYFDGFSPNVQIDTYDLASTVLMPDLNIGGIVLDASQVMVNGARYSRRILRRTPALREEHLEELRYWAKLAEKFARDGRWPMAKASCRICKLRAVCAMEPDKRAAILDSEFPVKFWDPLDPR